MDLSIIIPIYNVEDYLRECLDSIYKIKGIKKEVILVNDGSPDNSQDIIDEYKSKYEEETIVIVQENQGLSGARNSGLKKARGKYISFIDSDDFIDCEKFIALFNECMELDLDVAVGDLKYYSGNDSYTTKSIEQRCKKLTDLPICNGLNYWEHSLQGDTNNLRVEVWINLYKRKFLVENKIEFIKGLLHEDTLFTYNVMLKATKVKYMPYDFYYYRMREGSIMKTPSYKNFMHKMYIANELQTMKENRNFNLKSWDTMIFDLYFTAVKTYKIKNTRLYSKIKHGKNLTTKSRIKKALLNGYHILAKEVEIDLNCS